jgi:hypothetical protein
MFGRNELLFGDDRLDRSEFSGTSLFAADLAIS